MGMFTPAEIEGMIQDCGGVPVSYSRLSPNAAGLRTTFALEKHGSERFGEPGAEVYADAEFAVIATGRLESVPESGDDITVNGVLRYVLEWRRTEGGTRTLLLLGGVD